LGYQLANGKELVKLEAESDKEDRKMIERKMKKNQRELKSLRHRANPHVYDKKVVERKIRLRARILRLKTGEPEAKA
jgi:hypothetical protein